VTVGDSSVRSGKVSTLDHRKQAMSNNHACNKINAHSVCLRSGSIRRRVPDGLSVQVAAADCNPAMCELGLIYSQVACFMGGYRLIEPGWRVGW